MGNRIRSLGGDMNTVSVSEKAAKGTVANNTNAEPQRVLIGGGTQGESRQVIQLVVDGKKLAEVNNEALNTSYGTTDKKTGILNKSH
jgi:hypothetical protein